MARSEARIKTAIWGDQDFTAHTMEQEWAYFVVLSQSTLSLCGVTPYTPGRWSNFASDATPVKLRKAVAVLVRDKLVVLDETVEELWVRTLINHDNTLAKPNVVIGMTRDFGAIQSVTIRALVLDVLGERFPELMAERFKQRWEEGLWEQFGKPFREQFARRFPQAFDLSRAATHPEPIHQYNPSGNGSRCGACGNRGYVEAGGVKEPCPARCPATICVTCNGTSWSGIDDSDQAIPCPTCTVATA